MTYKPSINNKNQKFLTLMKSSNISKKVNNKKKTKVPVGKDKPCKCHTVDADDKDEAVDETTILSFKQFLNESDEFQDKYMNHDFVPGQDEEEEDDDDTRMHTDEELEAAHNGETHDDVAGSEGDDEMNSEVNNWNTAVEDEDEREPAMSQISKPRGVSKAEKLNNELMSVNAEIGRLLDSYKSHGDVQQYKTEAGPLLAKRHEIQAKLDAMFDVGLEDDENDLEMADTTSDDPYVF